MSFAVNEKVSVKQGQRSDFKANGLIQLRSVYILLIQMA